MSQQITVASASGQCALCGPNSGHPLVQMAVSSDWSGTVIFSKDTGTVSSGVSLTNVVVRERGSSPNVDIAAGVAQYAAGAYEPQTDGLPLYATVVRNAGSVTFTVLPEWAGTADDASVALSALDLSVIPVTFPEDLAFQLESAYNDAQDVSASS